MAAQLTKKNRNASAFMDVGIATFVVLILAMIIIPLPAPLLDLLLIVNLALSMTILLLTLFTKNVLEFSTFPTLLLLTTMFRLGLNISSTRLVLTEGDAGKVIDTFANLVAGNNIIVGAVIFIIIFIIQMIVVTNGAGRVSEVSARFTLDAMPGKQMSIDSDLNSGLINEQQAKQRRNDLERETQFFGAMDGASKFVKGDATAGIIITFINLIGGTLIYSLQQGMPIMEALNKFGRLTIGDGLVSQIPSLLISIGSGILVTRSGNAKTFGTSLMPELMSSSKVLYLVSAILLIFALLPGFPTVTFSMMAILLGGSSYLIQQNETKAQFEKITEEQRILAGERMLQNQSNEETVTAHQVDPISIEIGYGLISIADETKDDNLMNQIHSIRKQCATEIGILLKPIRIKDNLQLSMNQYVIKIKGNVYAQGELYMDRYLILSPGDTEFAFNGIATKEPSFGLDAMWITGDDREMADFQGYTVVDPLTVFVTHLKETIFQHSQELLGRQEVKQLLETLKETHNVVIDELIPDILRLGEVQKVLQNLLKENIPITDMVTVLETLADYGTTVKDIELLTEYVRQALKQTIVKNYLDENAVLNVVTIHPNTEEMLGKNIQKSSSGSIPLIQGNNVTKLFDSIKKIHNHLEAEGRPHVLLVSPKIRPSLKNLLTFNFPEIAVLSLNEVPNEIAIESVGMVEDIAI